MERRPRFPQEFINDYLLVMYSQLVLFAEFMLTLPSTNLADLKTQTSMFLAWSQICLYSLGNACGRVLFGDYMHGDYPRSCL